MVKQGPLNTTKLNCIENPYMHYNLFGLKFIMMQWKTFFVVALGLGT